jgi:hypothetical protein
MSKRKPATASKHAHSTKIAAQRANQAIVRSPKDSPLRSVAAGSTESPPERHDDSRSPKDSPLRSVVAGSTESPLSVITTQNKRLPLLRNRRQPYKMTANRR